LIGHAQFYISQRRRYNIRPYINDKYNPICNSDVPISNELFENDCHKRIKELGDPIKIPIGAHSYPSYRCGTYDLETSSSFSWEQVCSLDFFGGTTDVSYRHDHHPLFLIQGI
jgi:hypothetical protein